MSDDSVIQSSNFLRGIIFFIAQFCKQSRCGSTWIYVEQCSDEAWRLRSHSIQHAHEGVQRIY